MKLFYLFVLRTISLLRDRLLTFNTQQAV